MLLRVAATRGGGEVLEDVSGMLHDAPRRDARDPVAAGAAGGGADHLRLRLVRSLGYYTGAVFQVYDPAYGVPLGSGGRYDDLLGEFGWPLPRSASRSTSSASTSR